MERDPRQIGPWLTPRGRVYRLSPEASQALGRVLALLDLRPERARVVFGVTAQASAFVLGARVTVHRSRWCAMGPEGQLALLAHELVHVAQYARLGRLGVPRFLVRYLPEYHMNPDNYRLPPDLAAQPLEQVDVLDPRYTLDQLAERFRHEVVRTRGNAAPVGGTTPA